MLTIRVSSMSCRCKVTAPVTAQHFINMFFSFLACKTRAQTRAHIYKRVVSVRWHVNRDALCLSLTCVVLCLSLSFFNMHCAVLKKQPPAPKHKTEAADAKHNDHDRLVEPGAIAGALDVAWAGALFVMIDEKAKAIAMKKAAAKAKERGRSEGVCVCHEKAQKAAAAAKAAAEKAEVAKTAADKIAAKAEAEAEAPSSRK